MAKRQFEKPSMRVIKLRQRARLLAGSDDRKKGGDGGMNYIPSLPGHPDDLNQLA